MPNVFEYLKKLQLPYTVYDHPAVCTVEEAKQVDIAEEFGENKNLFLRNRKGNRHFLVTIAAEKQLDLNALGEQIGERGVGFASEERLMKYLGLTRGSVSPFGLLNDTNQEVTFILDKDLLSHAKLGFHPNKNTQTVVLTTKDFVTYLDSLATEAQIMKLVCNT